MFFQRLEDLRVDADKTQAEIAEVLSCKREVYRRYEKGIYEIPAWAVIRLAQYYRTSTDYIFGLTDIRAPYGSGRGRSGT
ncbi:MAG: helix-turn-helix transcriptional regulator [Oscillospiraceae bacterium]|nr:helix-turn-helix transcriptional regulator [Oscillospiraceae bacterium]